MHAGELLLLALRELGLLAPEPALGTGLGHALAGAHPDQVGLELGEGGQDVEEHPAHGVMRIMNAGAELKAHPAGEELVGDGAGVRHRAGEAVELRDHQSVPCPYGRERLVKAGSGAVGPREAMVD